MHIVCRVPEKPLQRSRSDFLRRHQTCFSWYWQESCYLLQKCIITPKKL